MLPPELPGPFRNAVKTNFSLKTIGERHRNTRALFNFQIEILSLHVRSRSYLRRGCPYSCAGPSRGTCSSPRTSPNTSGAWWGAVSRRGCPSCSTATCRPTSSPRRWPPCSQFSAGERKSTWYSVTPIIRIMWSGTNYTNVFRKTTKRYNDSPWPSRKCPLSSTEIYLGDPDRCWLTVPVRRIFLCSYRQLLQRKTTGAPL